MAEELKDVQNADESLLLPIENQVAVGGLVENNAPSAKGDP